MEHQAWLEQPGPQGASQICQDSQDSGLVLGLRKHRLRDKVPFPAILMF